MESGTQLRELVIDEKFSRLNPPLTRKARRMLEASISHDGCVAPLVVWKEKGILLDGHNRYRICHRLNIPFTVIEKSFPNRQEALSFVAVLQLGRRNVSAEESEAIIDAIAPVPEETESTGDSGLNGLPVADEATGLGTMDRASGSDVRKGD